ncbi:hypothetical protein [Maridesulfovibrio ferrireducens]|uniref:hypothetical protein n=1 Tax=Maridesulfovibrio ferrireducens TaxID=246191 RepID=UPI001A295492|nr:hypothetical protein [Maridesulfovibrio ferrireducens]MBI9109989.1 hypothetical protein [Maridesulfovibrio ferrireducens]
MSAKILSFPTSQSAGFSGFSISLSELGSRIKSTGTISPDIVSELCAEMSRVYGDKRVLLVSGNGSARVRVVGLKS